MGRCSTSLISFPYIWEWSKDQELPRQEGNSEGTSAEEFAISRALGILEFLFSLDIMDRRVAQFSLGEKKKIKN